MSSFLPEPPNRIGCLWQTGAIPTPIPPSVGLDFFQRPDERDMSQAGVLRNGWRISASELSDGNYGSRSPNTAIRLRASVTLDRHGRTCRYRLTRLVLSKAGGNRANALNEAS